MAAEARPSTGCDGSPGIPSRERVWWGLTAPCQGRMAGGAGAGGDRSWLSTSSSAKPQPLDDAAVAGTPRWPVGPWNTPAGLTDCLALVLHPGRHPARAHPEAWADTLSGTRDPGSPGGAGPRSLRGLGAFTCRMGGPQVPQRLGRDGPRCGWRPDRGRLGAQGSGCPGPSPPHSSLGAHVAKRPLCRSAWPSCQPPLPPATPTGTCSPSATLHIAAHQVPACVGPQYHLFPSQDVPFSLLWSGSKAASSRKPS